MRGSAVAICTGDFSASNYPLHTYINETCFPLSVQNKLMQRPLREKGGNVHTWSDGKVVMM